jgi:hypothetical protein
MSSEIVCVVGSCFKRCVDFSFGSTVVLFYDTTAGCHNGVSVAMIPEHAIVRKLLQALNCALIIYLLTAFGLTPGGSSTVHNYNQYTEQHNETEYTERNNKNIYFTQLNRSIQNIQPYIQ